MYAAHAPIVSAIRANYHAARSNQNEAAVAADRPIPSTCPVERGLGSGGAGRACRSCSGLSRPRRRRRTWGGRPCRRAPGGVGPGRHAARVRGHQGCVGPGVVLSQAVDAGEGLRLEEGGKAVLGDDLLDDLHDDQVLIGLDGVDPVLRGELQLAVSLALGQGAAVELELECGPVGSVPRFWSREKDPLLLLRLPPR